MMSVLFLTGLAFQGCGGAENEVVDTAAEKTAITPYDTSDPASMITAVVKACGGNDKLRSLKDVSYEYRYITPEGKRDISQEKYIFDQEASWAKYTIHEQNALPDLKGGIVQFFDGETARVYHEGKPLEDPKAVGNCNFLRQANYMWFMMMFKLNDPGTVYEYKGKQYLDGVKYDKLEVSYDPAITGKEQNDIYTLYINPKNHLVELFYFSLPAFGIEEPILLAKLTYEEIDGINVITKRRMFKPNPAGNGMVPMVEQSLNNVKFNNGFTLEGLSKEV